MATNVSAVYIQVVDDVISKIRDEFINFGAGESALAELQAMWEMKMVQAGAIPGNIERPAPQKNVAPTPVHDLNVPYEGPIEEYETPTADMLFPPTPLQTPIQTPLPGTDSGMYNIPTGPSDYAPSPIADIRNSLDLKTGRPSPYMQPPSPWMSQRPLGVDVNVAYVDGRQETDRGSSQHAMTQDFFMNSSGKRKRDDYPSRLNPGGYLPQQDGSGDITIEFSLPQNVVNQLHKGSPKHGQGSVTSKVIPDRGQPAVLPQSDGVQDDYDDLFPFQGVTTEDYNTPGDHVELRAPTPAVATPKPSKDEAEEDDEPSLNEDDDDDDELDDDQDDDEPNTQHLVLALFDKVTRTKSRWKCTLKDGIMHLNNRDILFNKANGEFEF
ncbi:transcription initiation factor IIA large subunit-like isoform X1 [Curcuma longa]|uniref:transcription initiation factor IIA large subunit-like isoform X1 n=1 Tax=Curcuma longa TaxID=136217 RepID=UPI003D9F7A75